MRPKPAHLTSLPNRLATLNTRRGQPLDDPEARAKQAVKVGDPFYKSTAWVRLRMPCWPSGSTAAPSAHDPDQPVIVDHIHQLADSDAPLDRANLQVTCTGCNIPEGTASATWVSPKGSASAAIPVAATAPEAARTTCLRATAGPSLLNRGE
jgi:hypothetical protein